LQRWFADTNHPAARDPYFLYAASNLGSLLALVAHPFVVEPRYPLAAQGWLWSAGYLLLVGLTAGCAWQLRRSPPPETGVRGQGSGVRSQGTGVRSQGTGVRSQESGVRGRSDDSCPLTPDSCSW